jgi:proton-translocating NADH-quinone oxidoreductase chain L
MKLIIIKLVSLLIYLSITSFFIPSILGKKLGTTTSITLVCMNSFLNVWIASLLFIYIWISQTNYSNFIHNWLQIEMLTVNLGYLIDSLSVSMLLIITLISFCASIYSIEYLSTDPHLIRYFTYLSLFTFFMIILVLAPNLLQLFIGWEGVGICSYLLINFWFSRYQANKSSLLAIFANKIGDITLIIAILFIQSLLKNIDFQNIQNIIQSIIYNTDKTNSFFNSLYTNYNFKEIYYENVYTANLVVFEQELNNKLYTEYEQNFIDYLQFNTNNLWTIITILLIISAIGKSAQFGFHLWLPEAMEGPTPVSSLIHAATMVTAGIFLILRNSELIVNIKDLNISIIVIGSITLFFAASVGIAQNDLKKVVAYSTCSQLGYMFLSCGFNNYTHSMYHLFIHAFFKALLFLTAGYILHFISNEQDIRKMGALIKIMPLGYILLIIGSYSLSGLPFLAGYYSKEPLLETVIVTLTNGYIHELKTIMPIVMLFAFTTIILTLIYSLKSIIDVFYFSYKGYKYYMQHTHYSNIYIQMPLIILSIASIYSGYIFSDLMIGINSTFLPSSMYINPLDITFLEIKTNSQYTNLNINMLKSIYIITKKKNDTELYILEYFPYYRTYAIVLLTYILILYVILKYKYTNYFVVLTIYVKKLYIINYFLSKKYISFNRLLITKIVISIITDTYKKIYLLFDKGIIELLGPYGITLFFNYIMHKLSILQTSYLYHYIGYFYISLVIGLSMLYYFI